MRESVKLFLQRAYHYEYCGEPHTGKTGVEKDQVETHLQTYIQGGVSPGELRQLADEHQAMLDEEIWQWEIEWHKIQAEIQAEAIRIREQRKATKEARPSLFQRLYKVDQVKSSFKS
jgi:hypothetical protein